MSSDYIRSLKEKPFSGSKPTAIIGIDVGTTFSGVSYSILFPGQAPKIHPVVKQVGFNYIDSGDHKIPSVLYYDEHAVPRAIGAETTKSTTIQTAQKKGWLKVENFKMHLRPRGKVNELRGSLPPGKSPEDVMGDFLRYLIEETGKHISNVQSVDVWNSVKDNAIFVLGHPNGWQGYPQQRYRRSAVVAGLIPDTAEGQARLRLVTEGEASALTCLAGGLGALSLKEGFRFIIADCGGGTTDTTTFEITGLSPLRMEERALPDCRFSGSIFVNEFARDFLRQKLSNTRYDDEETLNDLIIEFEEKTKMEFNGAGDSLLKIGGRRDNDESLGILFGYLTLPCEQMKGFFQKSVTDLVDSVQQQLLESNSNERTTPIWLVGGFGTSAYIYSELKRTFEQHGTTVQTPNENLSKAVAIGAVLHYLDNTVQARVCPKTYGTDCLTRFDPRRSDHRSRPELIREHLDGTFIGPIFDTIAEKEAVIKVGKTFIQSYSQRVKSKEAASHFTTDLYCYDGTMPKPYWFNENKDKFRKVCTLEADLSSVYHEASKPTSLLEALVFPALAYIQFRSRIIFDIELKFGTTEVEARLKWEENGTVKYGPAKIVWLES